MHGYSIFDFSLSRKHTPTYYIVAFIFYFQRIDNAKPTVYFSVEEKEKGGGMDIAHNPQSYAVLDSKRF